MIKLMILFLKSIVKNLEKIIIKGVDNKSMPIKIKINMYLKINLL